MKTASLHLALGTAVLLAGSGCHVPTLSPLADGQNVVFDPALLGTWHDGARTYWQFDRKGDRAAYHVVIGGTPGEGMQYEGRLVRVGSHRFLEFFPDREAHLANLRARDVSSSYHDVVLEPYDHLKVTQAGPELTLAAMSPHWLESLLREHPEATPHGVAGRGRAGDDSGTIVLTGTTSQLQDFFHRHADSDSAFPAGGRMRLNRVPPAEDPK